MDLSVSASRTVNLSFGLRPVNSPVSAHSAPSAENTASPLRTACSLSWGAPKFQFTPLSFLKPNLSAPKAPLCTPVSCTKTLLEPAYLSADAADRAALAVTVSIPAVAPVGRLITDDRRFCQADPCGIGLFRNRH